MPTEDQELSYNLGCAGRIRMATEFKRQRNISKSSRTAACCVLLLIGVLGAGGDEEGVDICMALALYYCPFKFRHEDT